MGCTPIKPAASPPIIPGITMKEASRNMIKMQETVARSTSFIKCNYCGTERMGEGKCRNCGAHVEFSVKPTQAPSDGIPRIPESAMDKFLVKVSWTFVLWAIGAFLVYILS